MLWVGETTSALGSSVTSVALPLVALTTLHAGVVAVSLLAAAAWLPWLVIGLPAGAWIDRMPRRPVMIACDAVSLAAFASVPLAAAWDVLTMTQLLGVALLAGVAKVFFSTAMRAYVPTIVRRDHLVDANAKLLGAESGAQVAGPGLGGLLAQALGPATALLADAASFAVSLLCVRALPREAPVGRARRRPLAAEIAEGVRFVARDRLLRVYVVFGALANLVLIGYGAITVPFLVHGLGVGPAQAGLLLAAGQVGGVAGAVGAPWIGRRLGKNRTLIVAEVTQIIINLMLLALQPGQYWALVALTVAQGLSQGSGNLMLRAIVSDVADQERLRTGKDHSGLLFSIFNVTINAAMALSLGIALPLVGMFGFTPTNNNTPAALSALQWIIAIGPAIGHGLSAILMLSFPLTEAKHAEIVRARAEQGAAAPAADDFAQAEESAAVVAART